MKKETTGTVISVSKQWWFKINTKAVRNVPIEGSSVKVVYNDDVPAKAEIFY